MAGKRIFKCGSFEGLPSELSDRSLFLEIEVPFYESLMLARRRLFCLTSYIHSYSSLMASFVGTNFEWTRPI